MPMINARKKKLRKKMIFSYSISLPPDRYYLFQRSQINNKPILDISLHHPVICQIYLLDRNNLHIRALSCVWHAGKCNGARHFFERANANGLPQEGAMNITKNLGMLLLAIYLILAGITLLFHITIPTIVMGILALAAGILILIGR